MLRKAVCNLSRRREFLVALNTAGKSSCKCFSTTNAVKAIYPDTYADPRPDRKSYFDESDTEQDNLATKMVKAAPNTFTYSVFYDPVLYKFEKMILKKGKGALAKKILQDALTNIKIAQLKKYHAASPEEKESIEVDPLVVFHTAIENASPILGLTRVKKGSMTYQIPHVLSDEKRLFLVSTWMLKYIRSNRPKNEAGIRIGNELLAAYNNQGTTVKRKQALHKSAEANRAYINIRA
uniref:28S ribosomal protein S7, mitochondrial-like n=1 Tax=Ciona intestinalis TaxID=7719 RepID=UPI000180CC38|nr:28S ribosomal protein S7, mitochondrial-like [Ciona intestinalis]|eukprot:XP_004226129.1 28S ribosomal protein S7, mitochondrial-like [Ciona intestinalis]